MAVGLQPVRDQGSLTATMRHRGGQDWVDTRGASETGGRRGTQQKGAREPAASGTGTAATRRAAPPTE